MAKQRHYQKPRNPQFSMSQRAAIVKYHAANPRMQYEKIAEWAWDIAKEKEKNKTQKTIDSCFKKNLAGI